MKNIISLAILASSLISLSAMAGEKTVLYSCSYPNPEIRDGGYTVRITEDSESHQREAEVTLLSLAGPQKMPTLSVTQDDQRTQKIFSGQDFKLEISLESLVITSKHPAVMYLGPATSDLEGISLSCQAGS